MQAYSCAIDIPSYHNVVVPIYKRSPSFASRTSNDQFTYYVSFSGWAERYDRGLAERILLERKNQREIAREAHLRRKRAAEEFQVRKARFLLR